MSVKSLVQLEHSSFSTKETILRQPAKRIIDFGDEFQSQVLDLIDTLMHYDIAVGLAAPQIGISANFCAINLKQKDSITLVLVNPELISSSGKKDKKKESCMSLPHYRGAVERREKIVVKYQTVHGEEKELEESGFFARVIMHEIDHLNGLLYVDRMESVNTLEPVTFFK